MGIEKLSSIGNADVKSSLGGNYLKPGGRYLLEIAPGDKGNPAVQLKEGLQNGGDAFIARLLVIEAVGGDVNTPGTEASFFQKLEQGQNFKSQLGNVKAFAAALFGIAEEEVDFAGITALLKSPEKVVGRRVVCQTAQIKTKRGSDFTKHNWSPVEK